MGKANIDLMQRHDGLRYLHLTLGSDVKPAVSKTVDVAIRPVVDDTRKVVLHGFTALADALNEEYGDNFNVPDVHKEANELFAVLLEALETAKTQVAGHA